MRTFAQNLKITDEITVFGAITDRRLAGIRVVLAVAALLAIVMDPAEPDHYVQATYAAPITYTIYSLAIYLYAHGHANFSWKQVQAVTWTDVPHGQTT